VVWIDLALVVHEWWDIVNRIMQIQVLIKCGEFMASEEFSFIKKYCE
jgi:hypothetical protein